jgi:hypothetical protein
MARNSVSLWSLAKVTRNDLEGLEGLKRVGDSRFDIHSDYTLLVWFES